MAELETVRRAIGADAWQEHPPAPFEGVELAATLRPADGAELAQALRALGEAGLGAIVRGGGDRLGLGNPPSRAAAWLSTERLSGVDELDLEEGVLHARAGTGLAEIERELEGSGWELPLDPPGAAATLGGVLATAAVGPRHPGFGRPRDVVLGLEVVLGDGVRGRCGGRVVKNVTGYDLMKLHVGALGAFGVIEGAWLRLRPTPEASEVWCVALPDTEAGFASARASARLSSARAAVWVAPGLRDGLEVARELPPGPLAVVELAGDAAAVARDRGALENLGGRMSSAKTLAAVRELLAAPAGDASLRFQVAARPSRLFAAITRLRGAGASVLAHPATGLVHVGFGAHESEVSPEAAWSAVLETARALGAAARLDAGPLAAKRGRDVFAGAGAPAGLLAALKRRFDPQGVLNPGRFAGGL